MKFFQRKNKKGDIGGGPGPAFNSSLNHERLASAYSGYSLCNFQLDTHRSPSSGVYSQKGNSPSGHFQPMPTRTSATILARLPECIFKRIFAFLCPHSSDESYATYFSIRVESIHYCDFEEVLIKRRKWFFFDRNGQSKDPAQVRLKLLCRTLRESPNCRGQLVQFLKMPYMLRETCPIDVVRTIAVTPNLRYVDLPKGMFTNKASFMTLRAEIQARCRELRKITYMGGSGTSLQVIMTGRMLSKLEVLELIQIDMDPAMLRQVLGYLSSLRALKISQAASFSDVTLAWNDMMAPFPPLEEFTLIDVPNVTAQGLKSWMLMPEVRQALRALTLNRTGVQVWTLQELLKYLPRLKQMSIIERVANSMTTHIPPLSSDSLQSLHFEITAAPSLPSYSGVTASYYKYLSESLLLGGLRKIRKVYVRDPFQNLLLGLPPPALAFAEGYVTNTLTYNGFTSGGSAVLPGSSLNGSSTFNSGRCVATGNANQIKNAKFSSNNPLCTLYTRDIYEGR
ncbi:hypothetical protein N0V88_000688 [Collariella sp. IMI 366227]|nr:hypothetical protein N0V88_000688 [Collariella sp. IMI 366227]